MLSDKMNYTDDQEDSVHLDVRTKPIQSEDTLKKYRAEIQSADYDTSGWTEILPTESILQLDLRYATDNNFVKKQLYECGRCFLRPQVATALDSAIEVFQSLGYGLVLYDCYRPKSVQQALWDMVPNPIYVTDPKKGSMHNRGCAVDIGLTDRKGVILDMGTEFDHFGRRAHHAFTALPEEVLQRRQLLKSTLGRFGFKPITSEWWHYSISGLGYPLDEMQWNCPEASSNVSKSRAAKQ